jgi:ATP-dependent helicase/nuclease subunit A
MTRARECLVFSANGRQDRANSASSWWQRLKRLEGLATPWQPEGLDEKAASNAAIPVLLTSLPQIRPEGSGQILLPGLASLDNGSREVPGFHEDAGAIETEASRLGQAVHRVLQWATPPGARPDLEPLIRAAARQFSVSAERVAEYVESILNSPRCAPFFDRRRLEWAANEVSITVQGRVQRLDRLVAQRQADGSLCWWVLDYKLHESPQSLAAYRQQLLGYASALTQLQPGDKVRCAFITGAGELVEMH